MKAYLILEDGSVFEGESIGAKKEVISEFVFNTSMAGYLEVLSDPSYVGQAVIMTYPLIGNYGVCLEDLESDKLQVDGLVVNELARLGSNFRKQMELQEYLVKQDVPGIQGVDIRHITKRIRDEGCMRGMITTTAYEDIDAVVARIKAFEVENLMNRVTCQEAYTVGEGTKHVAVYDFGIRRSVINALVDCGCKVSVYPANTPAQTLIDAEVDGVLLSSGPGNVTEYSDIIKEVKVLAKSKIPVFAIGLGHQLLALAHDFKVKKMKHGHHGANYPVKNLETGRVYISGQNHNYVVVSESLDSDIVVPWFVNVNDDTIEGLTYKQGNMRSIQFDPSVCGEVLNSDPIFEEFMKMMEGK
jgi:carbamoyl-phosphate synthase small subunit